MPGVTVKANGTTLTLGTDYIVSYQDNINAGTATVLIEGLGNYGGVIVKNFTIQKAPMQVAFSNKTVNYDGSTHTITARIAKPLGSYTVRYGTSMDSCTLTELSYKNIGEYTIHCQIMGDENYESYSGSAKLTIMQVDVVPPTR